MTKEEHKKLIELCSFKSKLYQRLSFKIPEDDQFAKGFYHSLHIAFARRHLEYLVDYDLKFGIEHVCDGYEETLQEMNDEKKK